MSGMRNKKTGKINICAILLVTSLLSLLGLVSYQIHTNMIVENDMNGLAKVELISSSVQRISKLELEGSKDALLIMDLEELAASLVSADGTSSYFVESEEMQLLLQGYNGEFITFFNAIERFRVDGNRDSLFSASEYHYLVSEELIKELTGYNEGATTTVQTINIFLVVNILVIVLCMAKIFFNTHLELVKNKELSKEMYIDTATGVFNRAKCQLVMKKAPQIDMHTERAIVIFDLNDLKKTNDNLGHRAGDDLISSFAEQLIVAKPVVDEDLFVGRYGGDEFIAVFESTSETEVQRYLKEVDDLILKFNETQDKPFILSCAAGYAITSPETKSVTTRELFDVADGNMYENKIAMKARRKQEEYIKETQKAELEATVSDADSLKSKA